MAQNDYKLSRPVSAVTPVLSSLVGAVRAYVESVFPAGYFKDYFVDTDLPIVQMRRRRFRPMSPSQLSVRRLPMLSVKADPTADSSDFSSGVSWHTGNRFLRDPLNLRQLIKDDVSYRYVGFETERIVCRFQASIIVETEMKARELMMYMKRVMPLNYKVFLTGVTISTEIPPDILRSFWKDMGYGDGSDPAQVDEFHRYLRAFTAGHVERVTNTATGRTGFFFDYVANPIMTITGTPSISINRDGSVVRSAQVDLPLELDLGVPLSYAYRQEAEVQPTLGDLVDMDWLGEDGTYFGRTVLGRPPANIDDRRSLAFFTSFVTPDLTEMSVRGQPDVTDFSDYVSDEIKDYVAGILSGGDPASDLAVRLWVSNGEVDPANFSFDWETWKLTVEPAGLLYNHKYSIGLYADLSALAKRAVPSRPQAPRPYY